MKRFLQLLLISLYLYIGRISRYLANKCAIASRIDSFIDEPTTKYGDVMREQVEERLAFYESGAAPRKNLDVMNQVSEELKKLSSSVAKPSKKKRKSMDESDEMDVEKKESKKAKKEAKKAKKKSKA
jgi:nucleolar protein 56